MEETGTVINVGDHTAVISTEAKGVCQGCSARGVCHMGGRRDTMEVEAWNRPGASVGDQVRIRISGRSTLTAVLLLYLVPLAGFLLGVLVGEKLTGHQAWAVVIGSATLAVIYGAIRLLDRRIGRSDQLRPEIVEILARGGSPAEAEEGRAAGRRTASEGQPSRNETG